MEEDSLHNFVHDDYTTHYIIYSVARSSACNNNCFFSLACIAVFDASIVLLCLDKKLKRKESKVIR